MIISAPNPLARPWYCSGVLLLVGTTGSVSLGSTTVSPAVIVVVWPVHVTLGGHTVTVVMGRTHVHVLIGGHDVGPKVKVQVVVWPWHLQWGGQ